MRFVIVTGMSGAGKSTALKMLEDAGKGSMDLKGAEKKKSSGGFLRRLVR